VREYGKEDIEGISDADYYFGGVEGERVGDGDGVVGFDDPDALIDDIFASISEHLEVGG